MFTFSKKSPVIKIAAIAFVAVVCLMAPEALAAKKGADAKNHHPKDVAAKVEKIFSPLVTTAAADNSSSTDKTQTATAPSDPTASATADQSSQTATGPAQTTTDPAQTTSQTDPSANQTNSTDNQTKTNPPPSISMPTDVTPTPAPQPTSPPPTQVKKPTPAPTKQVAFNFTLPKAVNETNNTVVSQTLAAVPASMHNLPMLSDWEPFTANSPYGFTPLSNRLTAVLNTAALALLLLGLALVVIKRQQLSAETEDEAVRNISISLS